METIELKVDHMTCGACVTRVRTALLGVPGVRGVEVDLARGIARATANAAGETLPALLAAVVTAGYPAILLAGPAGRPEPTQRPTAGGCGSGTRGGCCCCGH